MRFLQVLGLYGIIAQASLQPEGPESRILVLPSEPSFLPPTCNPGHTFCELDHLPSADSYPTTHVKKLTHKLKRLRGSILLPPTINNITDSVVTDFLKRLRPPLQGPSMFGGVRSSVDNGQGIQGHGQDFQGEGSQPNRVTPVPDLPGQGEQTHSSMEVDEDDVETPLCLAHTKYVRPRAALNLNLEWRFIINLGDDSGQRMSDYEQVVKVEVCLSEGFSCDIEATGHETVCRQKFTSHRMLALNGSGVEYVDTFLFPAACLCHKIRKTLPYLRSRRGGK